MAKKDANAIVSGAGWILSFGNLFTKALRERGCTNDDIHALVTDTEPAKLAIGKIADAVAGIIQTVKNIFRVIIDYGKSLSEMVASGKYNWVNPDINAKNFSVEGTGKVEANIELIHFNRTMESDEVLRELDRMGYRPANLPELLAFGASYPEKQREFPIVALGSIWRRLGGRRNVAFLYSCAGGRKLDLGWCENGWGDRCRFAAVRK